MNKTSIEYLQQAKANLKNKIEFNKKRIDELQEEINSLNKLNIELGNQIDDLDQDTRKYGEGNA